MSKNQSRRDFLKKLGLSTAALPMLPSLYPSLGFSQGLPVPKRVVFIRTAHGTRQENWEPYQLAPTQVRANVKEGSLSSLFPSGGINKLLDGNFSPYLNQLTYIKGLDVPVALGHNGGGMLGHYILGDNWETIDQKLAKSAKYYGTQVPVLDSLLFSTYGNCSYMKQGDKLIERQSYSDPKAAFDLLFNFSQGGSLARNSKALQESLKQYQALKNSSRLSAEDKKVMDVHLSLVSELDAKLKKITPVPAPTNPIPTGTLTLTQRYEAFVDVGVLAMMNNLTNILVINIEEAEGVGASSWHGESHNSEKTFSPQHYQASYWAAQKVFLRVISKMSQITESNGKSMLDNSMIFWGGEMSQGAGHVQDNMPVVLAGSMQGFIRPGRLLDYSQYSVAKVASNNMGDSNWVGRPYTQLLNTILQGAGLSPSDYERPGQPGYGIVESANLTRNLRYKDMIAEVGQVLPAIR